MNNTYGRERVQAISIKEQVANPRLVHIPQYTRRSTKRCVAEVEDAEVCARIETELGQKHIFLHHASAHDSLWNDTQYSVPCRSLVVAC